MGRNKKVIKKGKKLIATQTNDYNICRSGVTAIRPSATDIRILSTFKYQTIHLLTDRIIDSKLEARRNVNRKGKSDASFPAIERN